MMPGSPSPDERGPVGQPPEQGPPTDPVLPEEAWKGAGRPLFLHPQWTVGVVLVLAVVMLMLGLLAHPLWLLIGSPFILVLLLWTWVRIVVRRRSP